MTDNVYERIKIRNQLLEFGYFSENLPPFFTSNKLISAYDELIKAINYKELKNKQPLTFSIYKQEHTRRIISIPNPESFLYCVKAMSENWAEILACCESKNSLSPITYIGNYDPMRLEKSRINSENIKDYYKNSSDFVKGEHKAVNMSLGTRYKLSLDIANCYNSIYTHSVTWAFYGREKTKKYLRSDKNQKKEIRDNDKDFSKYSLGDMLDKALSYQKRNETNGIVVGPYTSRIFSEIIFSALDKKMVEEGLKFCRYVDDYRFYFRTEGDALKSISTIARILSEYNFNINSSKTKIEKYPFDIFNDLKMQFNNVAKDGQHNFIENVLNFASKMYLLGNKGAYKYALKILQDKELNVNEIDIVLPRLVNILLLEPKHGKYIAKFLKNNKEKFDKKQLEYLINEELSDCITNRLQQESIIFLYLLEELDININYSNFEKTLKSENDLAIIIVLYMLKRDKNCVLNTREELIEIILSSFKERLDGETYNGEHWLLLYECVKDRLLPEKYNFHPEKNSFFNKLFKLDVSFIGL